MPPHDVEVDLTLVRRLVDTQLAAVDPAAAAGRLTLLAQGWDNVVYRLGDDLTVRVPRRVLAAGLVEHEARWVPVLAPRLPVAVPVPVFHGMPDAGYPYPWLVCRWVPGQDVGRLPLAERGALALDLADTLVVLHRPAPADAPENLYRGTPLASRDDVVRARIRSWDGPRQVLLDAWDDALAAPLYDGPPVWLHGDPHPLNLAHEHGRLSGLLDFGDVTSGDPASDLATAWWTFDAAARDTFRGRIEAARAAGAPYDSGVWSRAAGWAASFASAMEPGSPLDAVAQHTARQLALDRDRS